MIKYEKLNIAILGFGTVGKGVYDIINRHETDATKKINVKKILVRTKAKEEYKDEIFTDKIEDIINDEKINLVVECIGGVSPAFEYVSRCLETGKNIVTSNKILLATKYNELVKKYKDQIKYEATVCGGIHVFHAIDELKNVDNIKSFKGIINGTTNYILTKMEKDQVSFEDALIEAKNLGYAESDPMNDIEGIDAFYKAVLLHNEIFDNDIEATDNFIKENIKNGNLNGIKEITKDDIISAEKDKRVIKLLAYGDKNSLYVKPMKVDKNDLFSQINENTNCLVIESDNLGVSSYVGAGAGEYPTAHAVVLDICDFIK